MLPGNIGDSWNRGWWLETAKPSFPFDRIATASIRAFVSVCSEKASDCHCEQLHVERTEVNFRFYVNNATR